MALRIVQICDGCAKERQIRHVDDTHTFQWIEFYDNRYHMCPVCVKGALKERDARPLGLDGEG